MSKAEEPTSGRSKRERKQPRTFDPSGRGKSYDESPYESFAVPPAPKAVASALSRKEQLAALRAELGKENGPEPTAAAAAATAAAATVAAANTAANAPAEEAQHPMLMKTAFSSAAAARPLQENPLAAAAAAAEEEPEQCKQQ